MAKPTVRERFLAKVDKQPGDDGCWLWTACLYRDGYGKLSVGGKGQRAHRVAYQLFSGPIPEGLDVLHSCDVRRCVNHKHLFVGIKLDNVRDATNKGRRVYVRGEQTGAHKLTLSDMPPIREAIAKGESENSIGARWGVDHKTIWQIKHKIAWAHVPEAQGG